MKDKTKAEIKISYEGQLYQMDVDLLIVSLLNFSELIKTVSANLIPGTDVQLRINAVEKGSFIINLEVVRKALSDVLDFLRGHTEILDSVSKVVQTAINILALKKHLKGKKPDSIEYDNNKAIIINDGGKLIIAKRVYELYGSNVQINSSIEKMFEKLSENPEVEGITITASNEVFIADSNDFYSLAKENELLKPEEAKETKENIELPIVKIVFQKNRKWEFIYEGNKISAYIEDEEFWREVNMGTFNFSKGDLLVVNLEITKVFDTEISCFVNKYFRVLKVVGHRPSRRSDQMKFLL